MMASLTRVRAHPTFVHATSHGCPLGWLIHPQSKTIDVYRPGQSPERLAHDDVLDAEPVLPGFRLPVAEVFGWLRPPRRARRQTRRSVRIRTRCLGHAIGACRAASSSRWILAASNNSSSSTSQMASAVKLLAM